MPNRGTLNLNDRRRVEDLTTRPWWVDSIYKVGIPAAMACYLLWFVLAKIDGKLNAAVDVMITHTAVMEKHVDDSKETKGEIERSNRLLQQICFGVTPKVRQQECWK